jgi:hypothetical protein
MANLMATYESLTEDERDAIEVALDCLKDTIEVQCGFSLMNDDRAARAAEALAVYIKESKEGP